MAKLIPLTAPEAERMLLQSGFGLLRSKGSHRIYKKLSVRIVIPFHPGKMLHPKLVKQILHAIEATE